MNFDFSNIFNGNNENQKSSKKKAQQRRRGRTLRIEELENREMLDAGIWSALDDAFRSVSEHENDTAIVDSHAADSEQHSAPAQSSQAVQEGDRTADSIIITFTSINTEPTRFQWKGTSSSSQWRDVPVTGTGMRYITAADWYDSSANTATITFTGLDAGTEYYFRVGNGTTWSYTGTNAADEQSATPEKTLLASPTRLTANDPPGTTVTLSWTAPASMTGVKGYEIQYSTGEIDTNTTWTSLNPSAANGITVYFAGTTATVRGLTQGIVYNFQVRAVSDLDSANPLAPTNISAWSNHVTRTIKYGIAAPPSKVTVTAPADGRTSVTLVWTASPAAGVTGYTVEYRKLGTGGNPADAGYVGPDVDELTGEDQWTVWDNNSTPITGTTTTITGLDQGMKYEFRVKATGANNAESAYSVVVTETTRFGLTATPSIITAAPQVTATIGTTPDPTKNIVLTWNRINRPDGLESITYVIQYRTAGTGTDPNDANYVAPGAWTATGTGVSEDPATALQTVIVEVPNQGTSYEFRVMAATTTGTITANDYISNWSEVKSATTQFGIIPNPKEVETVETEDTPLGTVALEWTWEDPSTETVTAVKPTSYEVQYRVAGTTAWLNFGSGGPSIVFGTAVAGVPATTATISGLQQGESYEFRVKAKGTAGTSGVIPESDWVKTETATTITPGITAVPVVNAATLPTSPKNTITLTFARLSQPEETPTAEIYTYEYIVRKLNDTTGEWGDWSSPVTPTITGTTQCTVTLDNLDQGTQYQFQVRAKGAAVANAPIPVSEWSAVAAVATDYGTTARVSDFHATKSTAADSTGKSTVTLTWKTAPTGADKYQIRYRVVGSDTWETPVDAASNTSHTISGLDGTASRYEFQIRALNNSTTNTPDYGAWSATVGGVAEGVAVPGARLVIAAINSPDVNAVTKEIAKTAITLEWTAIEDATSYLIECYTAQGQVLTFQRGELVETPQDDGTTLVTVVISGLTAGTTYEFRVAAVIGVGPNARYSAWGVESAPTLTNLPFPTLTNVTTDSSNVSTIAAKDVSKDFVILRWDTVPGATGYQVQWRTKNAAGAYETWSGNNVKYTTDTFYKFDTEPNKDYEFRVYATDIAHTDTWPVWPESQTAPNAFAITPSQLLFSDNGVTVTNVGMNTIILEWEEVTGNEVSYGVQRASTANGTYQDISDTATTGIRVEIGEPVDGIVTATIRGLTSGTVWYFQVQAQDNKPDPLGGSLVDEWSDWKKVDDNGITTKNVLNSPVVNEVVEEKTKTSIALEWDAVPDAVSYEIWWRPTDSSHQPTGSGTRRTTTDTSFIIGVDGTPAVVLQPDTEYAIMVTAKTADEQGNGDSLLLITSTKPVLDAPVLKSASVAKTSMTLAWEDVNGATGYHIRYRILGSDSWSSTITRGEAETSYTITGLQSGSVYEYQIRAADAQVEVSTSWEETVSGVPKVRHGIFETNYSLDQPEVTATKTLGTDGRATIALQWNSVPDAKRYFIEWYATNELGEKTGSRLGVREETGTSYNIQGLAASTTYYIQVRAADAADSAEETWSDWTPLYVATHTRFARPGTVEISANGGITWTDDVNDTRLEGFSGYIVQYLKEGDVKEGGGDAWVTTSADSFSSSIKDFDPLAVYYVRVQTVARENDHEWVNSFWAAAVWVNPEALKPRIKDESLTDGNRAAIEISWTGVDGTYRYEYSLNGGAPVNAGSTAVPLPIDSNLTYGTQYSVRFRIVVDTRRGEGDSTEFFMTSDWSDAVSVTTMSRVAPPGEITMHDRKADSLTFQFDIAAGITDPARYLVQWKTSTGTVWSNGDGVTIAEGVAEFTISTDSGGSYDVRVRTLGIDASEDVPAAAASTWVTLENQSSKIPLDWGADNNPTVGANKDKQLIVTWKAVTDADDYQIRWRVSGSPTWGEYVTVTDAVTYTITGLQDGTLYDIQVIARPTNTTDHENSPPKTLNERTQSKEVADFDVDVVDSSNTSITIRWNNPHDAEVVRYDVECWLNNQKIDNVVGEQTPDGDGFKVSITGLSSGQLYTIKVTAIARAGEPQVLNRTKEIEQTTGTPIASPTNVVLTARTANSLTIAWTAPATDAALVHHYVVEYSKNANFSDAVQINTNATATSYGITELDGSTEYHIRVRAIITPTADKADSVWSTPLVTKTTTTLVAPTVTVTVPQGKKGPLTAAWEAVPFANGYQIEVYAGSTPTGTPFRTQSVDANTLTYTLPAASLEFGTNYYVRVRAIVPTTGAPGEYNPEAPWAGRTVAIPAEVQLAAVANLTVSALDSAGEPLSKSLRVGWNRVTNAVGYKIEWSTSADFTQSRSEEVGDVQSYLITGLQDGTTYHVRITALASAAADDIYKDSAASASVTAETNSSIPPFGKTTGVSAKANSASQLEVTWSRVGIQANGAMIYASAYEIEIATNSSFTQNSKLLTAEQYTLIPNSEAEKLTAQINALDCGTTYWIRVRVAGEKDTTSDPAGPATPLAAASITAIVKGKNSGSVTLQFSDDWRGYHILVNDGTGDVKYAGSLAPSDATADNTVTINGLLADTNYTFQLMSKTSPDSAPFNVGESVRTDSGDSTALPSKLTISAAKKYLTTIPDTIPGRGAPGVDSITLDLGATRTAVSYEIEIMAGGEPRIIIVGNSERYVVIDGLTPNAKGTKCEFKVTALNADGDSISTSKNVKAATAKFAAPKGKAVTKAGTIAGTAIANPQGISHATVQFTVPAGYNWVAPGNGFDFTIKGTKDDNTNNIKKGAEVEGCEAVILNEPTQDSKGNWTVLVKITGLPAAGTKYNLEVRYLNGINDMAASVASSISTVKYAAVKAKVTNVAAGTVVLTIPAKTQAENYTDFNLYQGATVTANSEPLILDTDYTLEGEGGAGSTRTLTILTGRGTYILRAVTDGVESLNAKITIK